MANIDESITIAVDAMGGDHAPSEIVTGAVEAAKRHNVNIFLVGDPDQVKTELDKHEIGNLSIKVIPSEGVVHEGDSPIQALRKHPRASILVATGAVKERLADACVSMGSTGATMAAASVVLGVAPGVERPALGGPVIGVAPKTIIIDIGANVDCRPEQLLSFAVIGDVFARQFWNISSPRVAILSVGVESGKGNRQVREASTLIAGTGLNFIGNIEPNDLSHQKADVVVCDGFVGNVVMKLTEGLGSALSIHLRKKFATKFPKDELEELLGDVYQLCTPAEAAGGGPLFGVNGVSVVGHGSAKAEAVTRAIGTAKFAVQADFISNVNEQLSKI